MKHIILKLNEEEAMLIKIALHRLVRETILNVSSEKRAECIYERINHELKSKGGN